MLLQFMDYLCALSEEMLVVYYKGKEREGAQWGYKQKIR